MPRRKAEQPLEEPKVEAKTRNYKVKFPTPEYLMTESDRNLEIEIQTDLDYRRNQGEDVYWCHKCGIIKEGACPLKGDPAAPCGG